MSYALRKAPVAVTGIGVITPLADEPGALMEALLAGRSAIEDAEDRELPARSRIPEFDARRYATVRGMRVYPRNTQLQICAATLALAHAGLTASALDPLSLGTVTASTYAHVETLLEYDRGLVTLGMQRTNPTLFPLALPSAPGALTALSLGAKAFAITVSDGDASGLAALGLASRLIAEGRAKVCVVTGAASECPELTLSARRAGLLTDREGFRVLDRASRGTVLGDCAVALVLETREHAEARDRAPLGYVRGQGAAFAGEPTLQEAALGRAARDALTQAEVTPEQLSLVSAGASGLVHPDGAEARSLAAVLGARASEVAVTAPKSLLGEMFDASGLIQAAVALLALQGGMAPPIAGLEQPQVEGLRYLRRAGEVLAGAALATSISHVGSCCALALSVTP